MLPTMIRKDAAVKAIRQVGHLNPLLFLVRVTGNAFFK
jgi:hypothetical protein